MERQLGRRAGLAIAHTRQWFGITAQACTLEARVVIAREACRSMRDVGAQEECRAVRAGLDHPDDTHVACERPMVDHLRVEDDPRSAGRHPLNARQLRPVPRAVVRLRTARAGAWRPIREKAAVGLTAPCAHLMERDGPDPLKACLLAVIASGDDVASWGQGLRLDDTSHVVPRDLQTSRLLVSGGDGRGRLCNTESVGAMVRDLEPAQS